MTPIRTCATSWSACPRNRQAALMSSCRIGGLRPPEHPFFIQLYKPAARQDGLAGRLPRPSSKTGIPHNGQPIECGQQGQGQLKFMVAMITIARVTSDARTPA